MTIELAHGLHPSVPESEYHARIPGVASKSVLDLVDRSPAHYAAWLAGAQQEETPALAFGKAFHCALLEPDIFARTHVRLASFGDCRKKENKLARDAWKAENGGKVGVDPDDYLRIEAMIAAVRKHPLASRMIRDGLPEATLRWQDTETGIECKSRADYYVPELAMVVDVKTTEDARGNSFAKSCANYRYHVQQALYESGFATIGKRLAHFLFVAVEKAAPHGVMVHRLDEDATARGWRAAQRNLETMRQCIELDQWPGYDTSINTLSLPPWAA